MERILRVDRGPAAIPIRIILLDSLHETLTSPVAIVVVSSGARSITLVRSTIKAYFIGFHEVKFGAIEAANFVRVTVSKRICIVIRSVRILTWHFYRVKCRNTVAFLPRNVDVVFNVAPQEFRLEVFGHIASLS